MKTGGIPYWFYEWWSIFDSVAEILPSNILEAMKRWESQHPLIRGKYNLPRDHKMILFFIEYGIPWILKWDFCIQKDISADIYALKRKFWVRWWNSFLKKDIQPSLSLSLSSELFLSSIFTLSLCIYILSDFII